MIELLVVVTIIGLLAAIIVPAIRKALESGKRARAVRQVEALDGAIKRFISEYGKPPLPRSAQIGNADAEFVGESQAEIVMVLLGMDEDWGSERRNTKGLVFLDVDPAAFGVKDLRMHPTRPSVQSLLGGGTPYPDPWGNPFGILMDLNMDDRITGVGGYAEIRAKVGVYSLGERGAAKEGNPPYKTW